MMRKIWVLMLVAVLTACWSGAAGAQAPGWRPIPSAPGIDYAPDLHRDVFRYQERYYFYDGGKWHRGRNYLGPWEAILQPPNVFYQVEEQYFRNPPGWARGKKTGWRGQPLPPGQMKKLDGNIPPGQRKKMGY
ncbi:MAG: hypothetical protein QME75_15320 [Deltaproteobacteria bacterium]|nr:hypothetical protein [Deltaproteobacteria bacterium]